MRHIWLLLMLVPSFATAQGVADSFQYPVDDYHATLCFDWGDSRGGLLHVAQDVQCSHPSTVVRAAANGKVMWARPWRSVCDGNWGTVVVIEHTLPGGNKVCSIYGHIDIAVAENSIVTKGQTIGDVADFFCPEGWTDHVHFGLYDGPFGVPNPPYPAWLVGYLSPSAFPGDYLKPDDFVDDHLGSFC